MYYESRNMFNDVVLCGKRSKKTNQSDKLLVSPWGPCYHSATCGTCCRWRIMLLLFKSNQSWRLNIRLWWMKFIGGKIEEKKFRRCLSAMETLHPGYFPKTLQSNCFGSRYLRTTIRNPVIVKGWHCLQVCCWEKHILNKPSMLLNFPCNAHQMVFRHTENACCWRWRIRILDYDIGRSQLHKCVVLQWTASQLHFIHCPTKQVAPLLSWVRRTGQGLKAVCISHIYCKYHRLHILQTLHKLHFAKWCLHLTHILYIS